MELLHTPEEIAALDRKAETISKLAELYKEDSRIESLIQQMQQELDNELAKYNHLIGTRAVAPPSGFRDRITGRLSTEGRPGTIIAITHFNAYSRSVRVRFQYDVSIGGGQDGHALRELKPLNTKP